MNEPHKRAETSYEIRPEDVGVETPPEPEETPRRLFTVAEILATTEYPDGLQCVPTGYTALDHQLGGGFRQESLYVLAGRTGAAKSTFALNVARRVALDGRRVLVLKLEESLREAVYRIHAATAKVRLRELLNGASKLTGETAEKLDAARKLVADLPISLSDVRVIDGLQHVAGEFVRNRGDLIVIDQLSMIEVPGIQGAYERATAISNHLRVLARNLRVPILVVNQVNRQASKAKKELTAHDLRDSGCIENDAAAVLLLDKATLVVREPGEGPTFVVDLVVAKNRYGARTDKDQPIQLRWSPAIGRVEPQIVLDGGAAS